MARPALAATRAVSVLNFLASHAAEEFSLSEIAAEVGINLASAHALLVCSMTRGTSFVIRDCGLTCLGPSVVALGNAALECHPAIDHARDEARRLSEELDLGVAVTALAGDDIVFLGGVGDHRSRGIDAYVGQRIPLVPPVGSVFVAWHEPAGWLDRATDRPAMEAVLAEVRRRGWAASFEPDHYSALGSLDPASVYDVVMIAAPVFGPNGSTTVAITLLGFPPGLTADEVRFYGERVRSAGLVATRRSGGRAPTGQFGPGPRAVTQWGLDAPQVAGR